MAFVSDDELFSGSAPAAKPAATSNFVSDDELFSDNAAEAPAPSPYSIKEVAKNTVRSAAQIAGMVVDSPVALVEFGFKPVLRARAGFAGVDNKTGARMADQVSEEMFGKLKGGVPMLAEKLISFFDPEAPITKSGAEIALSKLQSMIDKTGQSVEEATGGRILSEDVQYAVDAGFNALGAAGAKVTQKRIDAISKPKVGGIKDAPRVVDDLGSEADFEPGSPSAKPAEPPLSGSDSFAKYKNAKAAETDLGRSDARLNAEQKAYDLMQSGASKAQVEAVVRRNPLVGEAMDAILARRGMVKESRLGTILQGPVVDEVGTVRSSDAPDLNNPPSLPSPGTSLATVRKTNPQLAISLGLGGTAAALALAYPDEADDIAAATGIAGVAIIGKNRGLTLAELSALPNSASLGHVLNNSALTLKTFERLPREKFQFKKQEILDKIKMADVSKAEREIIQGILDGVPGVTVTAKQLGEGFKRASEGIEFKKEETTRFTTENEGAGVDTLGRIARTDHEAGLNKAPSWESETVLDEGSVGWAPEGGWPDEAPHVERPIVDTSTRLYKVDDPTVSSSHFGQGVFAHDRVFREGGIDHVFEVQSDFAQKGLKKPTVEALNSPHWFERDWAERRLASISKYKADAENFPKRLVRERLADAAREKANPEFVALSETARKAVVTAKAYEAHIKKISPENRTALADDLEVWQEIVDQSYREASTALKQAKEVPRTLPGDPVVRFATADTMAKVEGWAQNPVPSAGELELNRMNLEQGLPATVPNSRFINPGHQSLYNRHKKDVESFAKKLGGVEVTDAQGHTWIEVPTKPFHGPPQMYGKVDPEFVKFVAKLGIGAAVGVSLAATDQQFLDGLLGAAAAAAIGPAIRKLGNHADWVRDAAAGIAVTGASAIKGADYLAGALSTRIGNISQPLLRRARNYERNILERTHRYISETDAFKTELNKVPTALREKLNRAISTNDAKEVNALMAQTGSPRLVQEWNRVRRMLDTLGTELQNYNRIGSMRGDYFPRIVKDYEGLRNHFGKEVASELDVAIAAAEKRAIKNRDYGLSDVERSVVINSWLQGREAIESKPGFSKERKISRVTEELEKYYATPIEALHSYINSAVKDIEKSKFFGRDLKRVGSGEGRFIDIDASIGELLQKERVAGKITAEQEQVLGDVLKARFGKGDRASPGLITDLKNIAYMGLLGNVVSSASQLGDVATSVYMHGLRSTTAAVVRRLTKHGEVDMRNYGLEDHIAEEFVNTRATATALNGIFKAAGFTLVDKFGKNVALEAGRLKYQRQLQTTSGVRDFKAKYGKMFEGDIDKVISDLRGGKLTDLAREVHFTELSDMQPITKLELPQAYLEHPRGRFMYMLKTFMLKQTDIVRRDAYNEIKAGNVRKGVSNLLRYAVALGVAGATTDMMKDWMLGREVDFDVKAIPENALKVFGWSRYVTDKAEKDGALKSVVENVILPPYKVYDVLAGVVKNHETEKQADKAFRDFVKLMPIGGKIIESRALGGSEKAAEFKTKQERKDAFKEAQAEALEEKGSPLTAEDIKLLRESIKLRSGK